MERSLSPHGFARTTEKFTWHLRIDTAEISIELQKSRGNQFYYLNARVQLFVFEDAWLCGRVALPSSVDAALDLDNCLTIDEREQNLRLFFEIELIPVLLSLSTLESMVLHWHKSPLKGMGDYLFKAGLRGGVENNVPPRTWTPSRFRSLIFTKKDVDCLRYDNDPSYAAKLDIEQGEIVLLTRFIYALHLELVSTENQLSTLNSWLLAYFETVRLTMDFSVLISVMRTRPDLFDCELLLGVAVWNSVCATVDKLRKDESATFNEH
ncbi:MAG: hypothetical protein K2X93_23745 [Candidatus Obscuribacterales bacterium]|nr:hypothetical protein [Candidatus Obscuribacterales bacterium]